MNVHNIRARTSTILEKSHRLPRASTIPRNRYPSLTCLVSIMNHQRDKKLTIIAINHQNYGYYKYVLYYTIFTNYYYELLTIEDLANRNMDQFFRNPNPKVTSASAKCLSDSCGLRQKNNFLSFTCGIATNQVFPIGLQGIYWNISN